MYCKNKWKPPHLVWVHAVFEDLHPRTIRKKLKMTVDRSSTSHPLTLQPWISWIKKITETRAGSWHEENKNSHFTCRLLVSWVQTINQTFYRNVTIFLISKHSSACSFLLQRPLVYKLSGRVSEVYSWNKYFFHT